MPFSISLSIHIYVERGRERGGYRPPVFSTPIYKYILHQFHRQSVPLYSTSIDRYRCHIYFTHKYKCILIYFRERKSERKRLPIHSAFINIYIERGRDIYIERDS